jgi:hypothetical protein
MIIDGRPGTVRKNGNNAAHEPPEGESDVEDAIKGSILTDAQTITLRSILHFIKLKK